MSPSLPLVFDPPRRAMPPRHLADLDEAGRADAVAELGLPAFRGKQLANQYYGRLIADPRQMTDLPAAVREQVAEATVSPVARRRPGDRVRRGGDPKDAVARGRRHDVRIGADALSAAQHRLHFVAGGLRDGVPVLRDRSGRSEAQSVDGRDSRAGPCGRGGAARPYGDGIARPARGARLSNIVFMGMGEPLANYNRVLAAVRRIIAPPPNGFGISARSVTVSTVGLAPAIRKLADERLGVTLALSLHAPDDELRDTLVPVNNRWKVSEALDAARYYADATGRRVSIEYALIRDINDQPWRADLLGKRLHGALGPLVHVNLIPLNPTPGSEWDASPKAAEREFVKRVRGRGVSCTVRDTRGREIAAACGQLAADG